ncbi:PREDICTED: vascular endothelial growth factor receptor 1 isoform X2 [Nicrophorus vespilloides]|uniref:receptor protein-tyrosine kinase n=1 Tax=Nicrophorus vespilloides TaxID=110193 RepID=A0ABM1NKA1_NICVS|nr:PREDICTED: vascular endothelial growth factor receptor 1 isoform X2 [Nicrophorus vespilloides]
MDKFYRLFCCLLYFGFLFTGLDATKPKIYIDNKVHDYLEHVIASNGNFTVICEGTEPINWVFNETSTSSTKRIESNRIDKKEFKYSSTLYLENANYRDTGFFNCKATDAEDGDRNRTAELYLYVEDPEHLAVLDEDYNTLHTHYNSEMIIPCRPTSPNVKVVLYKNEETEEEVHLGQRLNDSTVVQFTPTIGFIITPYDAGNQMGGPEDQNSQIYVCQFSRDDDLSNAPQNVHYIIIVEPKATFIDRPEIEDTSNGHTIVGSTMHLRCHLNSIVQFSMKWVLPNNRDDHRFVYGNITSVSQSSHYKDLWIRNVTKEDQGNYQCLVNDYTNNNNQTHFVKVYDVNEHFINLTEENNLYSISASAGEPSVQWSIDVDTHPVENFTMYWLNNKNEFIEMIEMDEMSTKSQKYTTKRTKTEVVLKINRISITDFGNYTLVAKNAYEEERLNLFLNITDKPTLHIESSPFHFIGQKSYLNCVVAAYPKPIVRWAYKDCLTDQCKFNPIKEFSSETNGLQIVSKLQLLARNSGLVRCMAENTLGTDESEIGYYVTDIKNGFDMWTSENVIHEDRMDKVAVGDQVVLNCGASVYNYSKNIIWYKDNERLEHGDEFVVEQSFTDFSYKSKLTMKNVTYNESGDYTCKVVNQAITNELNVTLKVLDPQRPIIFKSNLKDLSMDLPDSIKMECFFKGIPAASIAWFKDDKMIKEDNRTFFNNNNQVMLFKRTVELDEGVYRCQVRNRIGGVYRAMRLTFNNKSSPYVKYVSGVAGFLLFLLIVCIAFLIIKCRKEKKLRDELRKAGLENFEEGMMENINSELDLGEQAELLPYDRKWEFPREKIKLGKQLGSGAFGVVMKAEAEGIVENEDKSTVAVKMVKRNTDFMYTRALVSELKIMVHLGKHLNVVNLLGACTKNIAKRELLVIVEFCRYGNLHNYLIRHRENFIDQIDPKTEKINFCIDELRSCSFSSNRSNSTSSKANLKYLALSFPKNNSGGNSDGSGGGGVGGMMGAGGGHVNGMMADYRSINTGQTDTTLVTMTPNGVGEVGQDDLMTLSNNSSIQPQWRSNYRGDYKGNVQPICTKDLLTWAFQVSRAMEYLSSRKVLHGDLAARNILLADNNIVKICDFGLAKSMYKNENYKKKGDGLMPIKWMAIESIGDRIFSMQSDVWSFGIVLWEFFSLAKTPYPGMEANERLYQHLKNGYRMDKPHYATKEIYRMMMDCWEANPLNRPSFTTLAQRIGFMLEENVRQFYIDLNDPYLQINTMRLGGDESDYLAMFSPPDFENLSSPQSYINEEDAQSHPNGYMCMKQGTIFSPRAMSPSSETAFPFELESSRSKKNSESEEGGVCGRETVVEMVPMLERSEHNRDPSDCTTASSTSFSNPSYHALPVLAPSSPPPSSHISGEDILQAENNYVNMPKNKSVYLNNNKLQEMVDTGTPYVNNTTRDWERVG